VCGDPCRIVREKQGFRELRQGESAGSVLNKRTRAMLKTLIETAELLAVRDIIVTGWKLGAAAVLMMANRCEQRFVGISERGI
jgi:hypothetical protein